MEARVFVSCGQRKNLGEDILVENAANQLRIMGFYPVVISNSQSAEALKEVIFRELQSSDYFLFIDFNREEEAELPISLFSHQELAIAAYLDMPIIGFREDGLTYPVGMTGLWQANYKTFERSRLLDAVQEEVKKRWTPEHKNRIIIDIPVGKEVVREEGIKRCDPGIEPHMTTYFQLPVRNGSFYKHGLNCTAYLSRSYRLDGESTVDVVPGDIKWVGMLLPNVHLYKQILNQPSFVRRLNALFIRNHEAHIGCLNLIGDNRDYSEPYFKGPGEFIVEYTIVSDTFSDSKACFHLTLGTSLQDAKLLRVEDDIFEKGIDK